MFNLWRFWIFQAIRLVIHYWSLWGNSLFCFAGEGHSKGAATLWGPKTWGLRACLKGPQIYDHSAKARLESVTFCLQAESPEPYTTHIRYWLEDSSQGFPVRATSGLRSEVCTYSSYYALCLTVFKCFILQDYNCCHSCIVHVLYPLNDGPFQIPNTVEIKNIYSSKTPVMFNKAF